MSKLCVQELVHLYWKLERENEFPQTLTQSDADNGMCWKFRQHIYKGTPRGAIFSLLVGVILWIIRNLLLMIPLWKSHLRGSISFGRFKWVCLCFPNVIKISSNLIHVVNLLIKSYPFQSINQYNSVGILSPVI